MLGSRNQGVKSALRFLFLSAWKDALVKTGSGFVLALLITIVFIRFILSLELLLEKDWKESVGNKKGTD